MHKFLNECCQFVCERDVKYTCVQSKKSLKVYFKKMSTPFKFKHPFTCLMAGPTQSGKTVFTTKLIEFCQDYISPPPTHIIWAYGEGNHQQMEKIQRLSKIPINFVEGLPDVSEISPQNRNLLILDDLMQDASNSTEVGNIFTRASHHRNLSVVLILQNIFRQGTRMRDISINTKYMILFKNPRDRRQIINLSSQIYPKDSEFLIDAYKQATRRPHGYLLLDFDQSTKEGRRVITGIFPPEFPMAFITQKKHK
jgi:hypothetical protein